MTAQNFSYLCTYKLAQVANRFLFYFLDFSCTDSKRLAGYEYISSISSQRPLQTPVCLRISLGVRPPLASVHLQKLLSARVSCRGHIITSLHVTTTTQILFLQTFQISTTHHRYGII